MSEHRPTGESRDEKSPWNSLERAKLIASAVTSLTVAGVGGAVSWQIAQDRKAEDVRAEENRRAQSAIVVQEQRNYDKRRRDQEKLDALNAIKADRAAQIERIAREDERREDDLRREDTNRRELYERDASAARRAEQVARYIKVVERRAQLWTEIAPRLNDMYSFFMYVGHWKDLTSDDILQRKRSTDKLIYAYRPFFSEQLFEAYQRFINETFLASRGGWRSDARLRGSSEYRTSKEDKTRFTEEDNRDAIHAAYYAVLAASATDLDLSISTPRRPSDPRPDVTHQSEVPSADLR